MRLLHVRDLRFEKFLRDPPLYITLSHRWNKNEASLADIERCRRAEIAAIQGDDDVTLSDSDPELTRKVFEFTRYVRTNFPHIDWVWVDSCCVRQESDAELSEAVNSMFDWYQGAELCIAFLGDVRHIDNNTAEAFTSSVWFERGWTLQELLASNLVVFVADDWSMIGHKGRVDHIGANYGPNLERVIAQRTGISELVLLEYENSRSLSVAEKMRWMNGRQTLREEDFYYALYGIFSVTPGANYGERRGGAKQRLLEAINQRERLQGLATLNDQPQSTQHTITTIPYERDPDFVSRAEFDDMQSKLAIPGARAALVGFGGVGKSQLAIEYCYQTRDHSPEKHIIWIHASSVARLNDDMQLLAARLDLPGRDEEQVNLLALVSSWLADVRNGKWLLVLDNADKADFLFEPVQQTLSPSQSRARAPVQYLPVCNHGTILVTTRRHAVAEQLVQDKNIITLKPSKPHAEALITAKVADANIEAIQALSEALDHIPLAVTQATAYIKSRSPRCTIHDYLQKLRRSENSQFSLLKVESKELRRDREEASNSILLTWQISFEHICDMRQSAADLLAMMSFYDHQGIPDFLVKPEVVDDMVMVDSDAMDTDSLSSLDDGIDAFEEDIAALRDYCFMSVSSDGLTFEMHHLVQLAARLWLKRAAEEEQQWSMKSLRRLERAYPSSSFQNWPQCRKLYPHAKLVLNRKFTEGESPLWQAALLQRVASFALTQGLHADAEAFALKCLELEVTTLADHNYALTTARTVLAAVYLNRSDYEAAERLDRKTLEDDERTLGADHPNTLQCKENLALTLWKRGCADEAIELTTQVMQVRERSLGPRHTDTLTSMSIYALFVSKQRRGLDDKARLCQEVIDRGGSALTSKEPKVLRILENLASAYYHQKNWAKTEQLTAEVLDSRTAVLGATHPATLRTKYDLAGIYRKQGLFKQAEELHWEVYRQRQAVLDPTHSKVWKSLAAVAAVLRDDHQYGRALELYQQAVSGYTAALGPNHPVTLECRREMERMTRAAARKRRDDGIQHDRLTC